MAMPEFIQTDWYGNGRAILSFSTAKSTKTADVPLEDEELHNIECYISSLEIKEFVKKPKVKDTKNKEEKENPEEMYACPADVSSEVWQNWLVHWEAWKEIYINLSWVHKYREHCKPDYIQWYDTYIEDYPYILPEIAEDIEEERNIFVCAETELQVQKINASNSGHCNSDNSVDLLKNSNETEEKVNLIKSDCNSHRQENNTLTASDISTYETESVEVNSCKNSDEPKDVKKNLDSLYDKHSENRYWIHLRRFLLSSGVETTDKLEEYFSQFANFGYENPSVLKDNVEGNKEFKVSDSEKNLKKNKNNKNGENKIIMNDSSSEDSAEKDHDSDQTKISSHTKKKNGKRKRENMEETGNLRNQESSKRPNAEEGEQEHTQHISNKGTEKKRIDNCKNETCAKSRTDTALKDILGICATHVVKTLFPMFSGSIQNPLQKIDIPVQSSLIEATNKVSQTEHTKIKKKQLDPAQKKLSKWLYPLSFIPVDVTKLHLENFVLKEVCDYEELRESQTVYQQVVNDGGEDFDLVTLDLLENNYNNEENARTHTVFDDDGNPCTVNKTYISSDMHPTMEPHEIEMDVWKQLTHGYQLAVYGKESPPSHLPKEVHKYWSQRYRLFLKYDKGIKLDTESWFSVTPEIIAAHHAYRCRCDTVVDAFCGAGGNAIQLAMTCNHVIAIDIDPEKIALAYHNASVYGVADRIEFVIGDFFQLAPNLKADVVYLSPPWGGTKYMQDKVYNVKALGGVLDCEEIVAAAKAITKNIALYLPKNSDLCQIIELADIGNSVDIEYNVMGRKNKSLTAYFGDLVYC